MLFPLIVISLLPLLSSGMQHAVKVGSGSLAFDPDTVQANQGDTIIFEFYPQNHSVAQAAFNKPCEPLSDDDANPVFSGFFPVDGDDTMSSTSFSMMVNNTDPMWLYCSQSNHCQSGQVMVVNPMDGSDKTLEKFREAAMNSESGSSPSEIFGGMVVDGSGHAQTTKGNPDTPATATMSASTSDSSTSSSSTSSSSSATQSNAAVKSGQDMLFLSLFSAYAAGVCAYLS